MSYKILKTEEIYRGKIFNVRRSQLNLKNGRNTWWEMVAHNGAAVILPLLSRNKVILVYQYRYPINKSIWELPAGRLERGELPLTCARRELQEEIGCTARRFKKMITFYSTPGFTSEKLHIFAAKGLTPSYACPDDDEKIKTRVFTRPEIVKLINQNKIIDAKTLIGLMLWLRNQI
ncbi:MAG: NUDIX hydrolase [Planctomycetota bacterium]